MNCDDEHSKQQTVIIVYNMTVMSPATVSSGSVGSVDIDMTVTGARPTQISEQKAAEKAWSVQC